MRYLRQGKVNSESEIHIQREEENRRLYNKFRSFNDGRSTSEIYKYDHYQRATRDLLVVKLTLCALGLLCMRILTGQTFLLCCCSFLRGPSSSSPSSPSVFLFCCGETLLTVDIPNVDNETDRGTCS